ncbi:hypothetical protein DM80_5427 [Burkholderia multivorans]|nr:hypothetical protein DM80_5427 [Burkholderia multivorans]
MADGVLTWRGFGGRNCTPPQTNLRNDARGAFHRMKGFRKERASPARNALMQRDNLYHDAI